MTDTKVYAARTKDREVIEKSSSGGVFTAISNHFLDHNDAILCASYNFETNREEFGIILTREERDRARGSVYIQSYAGDTWKKSVSWLKDNPGHKLLFVGVGCQAAGYARFMEMQGLRDRVTVTDLICHGAPSPKIWREYAEHLSGGERFSAINFRDKRTGWEHSSAIAVLNGREISLNKYRRIYSKRYTLRKSCSVCPYTRVDRYTDITIGDFWHLEKSMPDFVDPMGTSLILLHTDKGAELFESIRDDLDYRESNTADCWQMNLERPTEHAPDRDKFWKDYRERGAAYVIDKYSRVPVLKRIKGRIKRSMKAILSK
jgi:coenzyme F420-reducing hydrogenase beta subunit